MIKEGNPLCLWLALILLGLASHVSPAQAQTVTNPQQSVAEIYGKMTLLNATERKDVYLRLGGKTKAKIWLMHVAAFEIDNDLNPEQQSFIDALKAMLKGADLNADRRGMAMRLEAQKPRAIELFGQPGARALLVDLGGKTVIQR